VWSWVSRTAEEIVAAAERLKCSDCGGQCVHEELALTCNNLSLGSTTSKSQNGGNETRRSQFQEENQRQRSALSADGH
jgi:hypothetical protein